MAKSESTLLNLVLDALDGMKAKNITTLDVSEMTSMADTMVIASGNSTRHVKSVADDVIEQAKKAGFMPLGTEGTEVGEWVLVDLGDVIVHVMQPAAREYYDLERLWRTPDHHPAREAYNSGSADQNND